MNIVLIDNQEIILRGAESIIQTAFPSAHYLCFTSLEKGVKQIEEGECQLLVMEVYWPQLNARSLIQQVLALKPNLPIVVFSGRPEKIYAKWILQSGARGFVSKHCPLIELVTCIQTVLKGEHYLSQLLLNQLTQDFLHRRTSNPFEKLSAREMEICHFLLEGHYVSEIASIMKLHASTIGTHQHRILKKLGVQRVSEIRGLAELYM